jgi:hypothetical protein
MPHLSVFKVAYTLFQKLVTRAYAQLYFCGRKGVHPPLFLARHHLVGKEVILISDKPNVGCIGRAYTAVGRMRGVKIADANCFEKKVRR